MSFSYAPDFSKQKYGYVKTVQSDTLGNFKTYSPFEGSIFGVPSSGQSMAINASLSQTLEMKVLSKRDTSGVKKIKLIDELRIGQVSYNFLADSMDFRTSPFRCATVFQNFGININATLDPYRVTRRASVSTNSFSRAVWYRPALRSAIRSNPARTTPPGDQRHQQRPGRSGLRQSFLRPLRANEPGPATAIHDPGLLRLLATLEPGIQLYDQLLRITDQQRHDGLPENITQTLGINGSVTILPKWV